MSVFYVTMIPATRNCVAVNGIVVSGQWMRNDVEGSVRGLVYDPWLCMEGLRKITKGVTIVFVLAEIRTGHVPSTNQKLNLGPTCSVTSVKLFQINELYFK
jgi:hypothetical protein